MNMATFLTIIVIATAVCFITYTNGSTISCSFSVQEPVYEGTSVTLSCFLQSINTDYAVTVKRNGNEVTPRITLNGTYEVQNSRYTVRTTDLMDRGDSPTIWYYLDITDVTRDDDGWYVVEVLSHASSNPNVIVTEMQMLDVYYLPIGPPTCGPGDVHAVLANEIPLICTTQVGKPSDSISLQWIYQNSILSSTTTISNGAATNILEFVSASTDTLYVTCSLSIDQTIFPNEAPRECQAGPIQILSDPIISVTPNRLTALSGADASFTCNIENDPIATRTWLSDSLSSDRFSQTEENNEVVLITNVQPTDSGTITCRVGTGDESYVEDSAELIVTIPSTTLPSITTKQLVSKEAEPTEKRPITKPEPSSIGKTLSTVTGKPGEQSPALSPSAIIGIIVCIVVLVLVVIVVIGLLIWKSRRHNDP
ncbi:uncharacterized protein [Amphiura filiformis]|uniref:uncharacterized protein n=1 Tax=Amphiura filiformis TaxID=82378 RepID=UPI003B21BE45